MLSARVRGVRIHEDLHVDVGEIARAECGYGEVRIRTEATGICGSDVHAARTGAWIAYWPATTGHEVVGVVTDSRHPAVDIGTRVVADSRIPCRECEDCAVSPRLCGNLAWLGESRPGGFATELVMPGADVIPVPDGLAPDIAVLAEPLAVVLAALDRVPADALHILIIGYGPIGALAHLVLAGRGLDVTVREPDARRRSAAAERGAEIEGSGRVDVVIDAAGYRGSVAAAFDAVRRGGTVLLVALGAHPIDIPAQDLVEKGVRIETSIGFEDGDIARALTTLAEAPEAFAPVVSHRISLAEAPSRLLGGTPGLGKVVVSFS